MSEKCQNCRWWNNEDTGFEDKELGECRRYPPVILDSVYKKQIENNMEPEDALWIAASFPVLPDTFSSCGEFKSKRS